MDFCERPEAGVSVAEELLGVGKGVLDGFLSSLVERLAPVGQAIAVNPFAGVSPDMTGDGFLCLRVGGARRQQGAVAAL